MEDNINKNSPEPQDSQLPVIDGWMDKEALVYIYDGMLFGHKN